MSFKLAVVQMDCVLGDVDANLERIDCLVCAAAAQGAMVAVLPELATTGYFVGDRLGPLAESIPGPTTDELGQIARRHECYVMAGMIEQGKDCFYNSAALLAPDGSLHGTYRKVHLFSAEREAFTPGTEPALFDIDGTRVALTICYDPHFPRVHPPSRVGRRTGHPEQHRLDHQRLAARPRLGRRGGEQSRGHARSGKHRARGDGRPRRAWKKAGRAWGTLASPLPPAATSRK